MSKNVSIKEQVRRNLVALISLAIAVTSLGYNTWRNEASEHNRNQRLIAVELLSMVGEMNQAMLEAGYGPEVSASMHRRKAWAMAATINDLAMVAEGDVPAAAQGLFETWKTEVPRLRTDEKDDATKNINAALERVRSATHEVLRSLD